VNRTLPLGERYDPAKAIVNDAELIVTNGNRTFVMERAQGFYPYDFDFNYGAVTERGSDDYYSLTVRQGGKTAAASLALRSAVLRFDSIWFETVNNHGWNETVLHYRIPAPGKETDVELLMEFWDPMSSTWWEWGTTLLPASANRPDGMLQGSFFGLWMSREGGSKTRYRFTLTARNRAYTDYFNSRWDWNTGDSPFDPPQKNPLFNVTGDGIGFFWYEIVGEPVEIVY
ncbi:MAG: hypothetical protein KFF77_05805, partial [Bacteroidetes bacterium]|nr:hypothetical protein [Bacteroidota bacterium]